MPFWKRDWLLGLVLAVALAALHQTAPIAALEGKAYDVALRNADRPASPDVAIIAIDDQSIANLGRWPWPRDVHAKLIDYLAPAGAKAIASMAFFSEPERDRALPWLDKLDAQYQAIAANDQTAPIGRMGELLRDARAGLDTDARLAASVAAAGNVFLPIMLRLDLAPQGGMPDLPAYLERAALKPVARPDRPEPASLPLNASAMLSSPIESIGKAVAGMGHVSSNADVDGVFRSEPLVVDYHGLLFPSFSLLLAARALNLARGDIRVEYDNRVQLGPRTIATGDHLQMRTHFYGQGQGRQPFTVDSFFDVYAGKIPASKYRDKIVLIGPTAAGLAGAQPTPVDPATAPVLILANAVSSIVQGHFVVAPPEGSLLTLAVYAAVALYLMFLLGRLPAHVGAMVSLVVLLALLAVPFFALTRTNTWLQLMLPAVLLVVGHLALTTSRFFAAEVGKAHSDAESAESNRLLALAFQSQGQLDLAFDKFMKCPPTESLLDNLYGLALDFERKRQFNKAEAVFRHVSTIKPDFRDVAERLARAKKLSETVILSGGARGGAGATLLTGGSVEKPMLGRYQVEKELGRGAMGAVYLGRDPKIGRLVAIKTMALGNEFEGDELADAKSRFFREAETAGRLTHPNIVTIFDAGEEHDLAYIAMEFLKGQDLAQHVKADALLPLSTVLSIIVRVAEALDYAHKSNVVHRDIKPGNIMYEAATDTVKVTDFGIARITDASRTKTGMVLGTPSFMSPEQLAGRRIDGRSDLYSLAVTLFQLACGRLPFTADSMAGLMFKITNEEIPDIRKFREDLPEAFAILLRKALAKDPKDRFQTGQQFAMALAVVARATARRVAVAP